MRPKVICFDFWKTLATEPLSMGEIFELLRRGSVAEFTYADFLRVEEEILLRQAIDLSEGLTIIGDRLGVTNREVLKEVIDRWRSSLGQAQLFDDVIPTLTSLKENGYCLVLITNITFSGWQAVFRKFPLSDYFSAFALSFELGLTKPDPRIFASVEEKVGVSGDKILMAGDSWGRDLLPAQQRGWQAFHVKRPERGLIQLLKSLSENQ